MTYFAGFVVMVLGAWWWCDRAERKELRREMERLEKKR